MTTGKSKALREGDRVVHLLDGARGTVTAANGGSPEVGITWDDCGGERRYCHESMIHVERCAAPRWELPAVSRALLETARAAMALAGRQA